MHRCGSCHFGKFLPADLTKRICWGSPPQVIRAEGNKVQMARPLVSVSEEACALFRAKDMQDMKTDAEQFAAAHGNSEPAVQ